MSIIKLYPENFQTYKLIANPKKIFHSKSDTGVTGSIGLFSDASPSLKELYPTFEEAEQGFSDDYLETWREVAFDYVGKTGPDFDPAGGYALGDYYMNLVNSRSVGQAQNKI